MANAFDQFDDPSTAPQKESFLQGAANVVGELAAGFNRSIVGVGEMFTTDPINSILELSGSDKRIPKVAEIPYLQQGVQGGQMEAGIGRDLTQAVGEVAGGFINPPAAAKRLGDDLPDIATAGAIAEEHVVPLIRKFADKLGFGKTQDPYKDVESALRSGKGRKILPEILADPEVLKAADDLGINVNPSVYSTSDIYREMENSLKAIPGSKLSANEKDTVRKLSESADNLLLEWTGTLDKSQISQDFSERMLKQVDDMAKESDIIYDMLDKVIPKVFKISPKSTKDYIEQEIQNLGGIEFIDAPMLKIYKAISQESQPTYALIDKLRKDVGTAAFKNKGPFKDASTHELKQLYATLTDDAMKGAELFGLTDEVTLVKSLVRKRKVLEESLVGALGKDLSKSLMAELGAGVKQLMKGQTGKFEKVMASVPEGERQNVAISALNDIFAGGATKSKGFSLGGFVGGYESLARNKAAASKLYEHIPPEVKSRLDSIYKVSKGLMEANKKDLNNPSGTARAVIGAMDAPNGIIDKLFKIGRHFSTAAMYDVVNSVRTSKSKVTDAATDMITSPAFQRSMQKFIDGQKQEANTMLESLGSTKFWMSKQSDETRRLIARHGLIQYLSGDDQ